MLQTLIKRFWYIARRFFLKILERFSNVTKIFFWTFITTIVFSILILTFPEIYQKVLRALLNCSPYITRTFFSNVTECFSNITKILFSNGYRTFSQTYKNVFRTLLKRLSNVKRTFFEVLEETFFQTLQKCFSNLIKTLFSRTEITFN